MTKEYWRWKEYNWHDENMDPRQGKVVTGGVDVGSVSSQAVVMVDGKLYFILPKEEGGVLITDDVTSADIDSVIQ